MRIYTNIRGCSKPRLMLIFQSSKHLSHYSLVYAFVSAARIPYTIRSSSIIDFLKTCFRLFLLLLFIARFPIVVRQSNFCCVLLLFASFSPSFAYLENHTLTQYNNNLIDIWLNIPRSIDSFASIAICIHCTM